MSLIAHRFLSRTWLVRIGEYNKIVQLPANISALCVIDPHGELHLEGRCVERFAWASITKILTVFVFADAVASEILTFDTPTRIEGVTFADLLSHASGIRSGQDPISPRTKRVYTNEAYRRAEQELVQVLGEGFESTTIAQLFEESFAHQLESTIRIESTCDATASGTFDDLVALLCEMRDPQLIDPAIHTQLTTPHIESLPGIVPGWGSFAPNLWGIGYEIHGTKNHWMGSQLSERSYGHFGMSGSFVVHDPEKNISLACKSSQDFGPWAKDVWPDMVNNIVREYS